MSKRIAWALLVVAATAHADDKKDAQAKVDAAKAEICEKSKKFLADQDAKGRCRAEHEEARNLACSAATFKPVTDLQTRCITDRPVPKDKEAPAASSGIPRCRALDLADATKVIAAAEDKLSTTCVRMLDEKLQDVLCADAAAKGKSFDYTLDVDHTVGTGKFAKKLEAKKKSYKCYKAGPKR
jgi:hypothetical protein